MRRSVDRTKHPGEVVRLRLEDGPRLVVMRLLTGTARLGITPIDGSDAQGFDDIW